MPTPKMSIHMSREAARVLTKNGSVKKFTLEGLRYMAQHAKDLHSKAVEVGKAALESRVSMPKVKRAPSDGAIKFEADVPVTPKRPSKADLLNESTDSIVTPTQSPSFSPNQANKTPTRGYNRDDLKKVRRKLDFGSSKKEPVREIPKSEDSHLELALPKQEAAPQSESTFQALRRSFSDGLHGKHADNGSIGRVLGHKLIHPEKYGSKFMQVPKAHMSTLAFEHHAPQVIIKTPFANSGNSGLRQLLNLAEEGPNAIQRTMMKGEIELFMKTRKAEEAILKVQGFVKKYFGDQVNLQMFTNGSKDFIIQTLSENSEFVFSIWKAAGMAGFGVMTIVHAHAADPRADQALSKVNYINYDYSTGHPGPSGEDGSGPVVDVVGASGSTQQGPRETKEEEEDGALATMAHSLAIIADFAAEILGISGESHANESEAPIGGTIMGGDVPEAVMLSL